MKQSNITYKQTYHFLNSQQRTVDDSPSLNVDPKINTTIKENPYKQNVEIEKDEIVLRPDLSAVHKAGGKKHSQGGTGVFLQPDSFVFSDDKTLAFNKKDIEMFELKPGAKYRPKNNTPAKVLEKNIDMKHYNKLTSILEDPNKDKVAKDSAAAMLDKYMQTLGNIAYVQEQKKMFPDGIPEFSMGTAPVYDADLKDEIMEQKQYMKYGGKVGNPYLPKMQEGGPTKPKIVKTDEYEETIFQDGSKRRTYFKNNRVIAFDSNGKVKDRGTLHKNDSGAAYYQWDGDKNPVVDSKNLGDRKVFINADGSKDVYFNNDRMATFDKTGKLVSKSSVRNGRVYADRSITNKGTNGTEIINRDGTREVTYNNNRVFKFSKDGVIMSKGTKGSDGNVTWDDYLKTSNGSITKFADRTEIKQDDGTINTYFDNNNRVIHSDKNGKVLKKGTLGEDDTVWDSPLPTSQPAAQGQGYSRPPNTGGDNYYFDQGTQKWYKKNQTTAAPATATQTAPPAAKTNNGPTVGQTRFVGMDQQAWDGTNWIPTHEWAKKFGKTIDPATTSSLEPSTATTQATGTAPTMQNPYTPGPKPRGTLFGPVWSKLVGDNPDNFILSPEAQGKLPQDFPHPQSIRKNGMFGEADWNGDDFKQRHQWFFKDNQNFDFKNANDVRKFQSAYNQKAKELGYQDYFVGKSTQAVDGKFGEYTYNAPGFKDKPQRTGLPGVDQFDPNDLKKKEEEVVNLKPGEVEGPEQNGIQVGWQFTPWQRRSHLYNAAKWAMVDREMPIRSHYNPVHMEAALLNPEQQVRDLKSVAGMQMKGADLLSPILSGATKASAYGDLLDRLPGVRSAVDNQNVGITNQTRQYNTGLDNDAIVRNIQNDQTYWQQSAVGRQNFKNMRTYMADQWANNVFGDASTNTALANEMMALGPKPAYGFDWKTGNYYRNDKNIKDVQSNTSGDTAAAMGKYAKDLLDQGIPPEVVGNIIKSREFSKMIPYMGSNPTFGSMMKHKKGGKVKNPYK